MFLVKVAPLLLTATLLLILVAVAISNIIAHFMSRTTK